MGEKLERLQFIFEELLIQWNGKRVECNGEDNHVHRYHPDLELRKLVTT